MVPLILCLHKWRISFAIFLYFIFPQCRIRMSEAIALSGQLPGTLISKVWILWLPMFSMSGPGQQLAMEISVSLWRSQPTQVRSYEVLLTIQGKSYCRKVQGVAHHFWLGKRFVAMNNDCNLENVMLLREEHFKIYYLTCFFMWLKKKSLFCLFSAFYKPWEMRSLNQLRVA